MGKMRFFTFRNAENGDGMRKLCDVDNPPDALYGRGDVEYLRVPDDHLINPVGTQAIKRTVEGFFSRQLPKNYKYANRHVKSGKHKGACVFHSQREASECAKRAEGDGEPLAWDN